MNTPSLSGALKTDGRWTGSVELAGDVIVPAGRRLVIAAGARIGCGREPRASPLGPRPAFAGRRSHLRPKTASLVVEGELRVEGVGESPAHLGGPFWGGLLAIGRGRMSLRHAVLGGDDHALAAADLSRSVLTNCELSGGKVGAAVGGCANALFRRCRFEAAAEAGLLACDDARVLASGCSFEAAQIGADAEGCSLLRLRGCRARGCRASGLRSGDASWARARGCRFEDCGVAATAQGRSRLEIRDCHAAGGRVAWEAIVDSRLLVEATTAQGQETGLWVQNRARAVCSSARFERGRFGLRASHRARLDARLTMMEGQSGRGAMIEDNAFATFRGCTGPSCAEGPLLLGAARADVDGASMRGGGDG